ncbi:hypothetical protein [Paenibacillus spongiae]|uniref:Uncharacterized protein n=1 Tax=Paenibacillus spongiae TaxID=2909671 RepID=A0ABY5SFZ9_9BACL|nr:hypothetical protein [Paenibacillus spongiae]UVI31630.1 hypothetical protein L1F29_07355 [Paenibacillus spongiae]
MQKEQICCVGCGKLIDHQHAHVVFRTGFYRMVYPLGCCHTCNDIVTADSALDRPDEMSGLEQSSVVHLSRLKQSDNCCSEPAPSPAASFVSAARMVVSL